MSGTTVVVAKKKMRKYARIDTHPKIYICINIDKIVISTKRNPPEVRPFQNERNYGDITCGVSVSS